MLAKLGITTDPKTGLAAIDGAMLDAALTRDHAHVVAAVTAFAGTFVTTVDFLNAKGHSQQRQMANLNRAVNWTTRTRMTWKKSSARAPPPRPMTPSPRRRRCTT